MSTFRPSRTLQLPTDWAAELAARARAIFDADCLVCGASSPGPVCAACEASLPLPGPDDGAVAAAFAYRFPVDRLVQRFKFAGDLAAGRWLASRLADRVRCEPRPGLLVAPPTTPRRLAERGFNPALHLARHVARELHLPCDLRGLERRRETAPQPGLTRRERRANLRDAFRCRLHLAGCHVALVDDVVTTGATADALVRVLRDAGAARVSVWAVARTPAPSAKAD